MYGNWRIHNKNNIHRFLPVKKSSDLLLVMSNLYSLHHGSLHMSSQVSFSCF